MESIPTDKHAPAAALDQAGEEHEIWWSSFAGRALWRSSLACILIGLAAYLGSFVPTGFRRSAFLRYGLEALIALLWLLQVLRWLYHKTAMNYRMTNRRLFRDKGFGNLRHLQIELTQVAQVVVRRRFLERWLGIGTVEVIPGDSSIPVLIFEGVRDPDNVAIAIRAQVQKALEGGNEKPA